MICIDEANERDWHSNGLFILQPFSCTVSEIAGGSLGKKERPPQQCLLL